MRACVRNVGGSKTDPERRDATAEEVQGYMDVGIGHLRLCSDRVRKKRLPASLRAVQWLETVT